LKLVYGAMPPDAITLIYAAAKGISLSKFDALSLDLEIGVKIKPAITKSGVGMRIRRGRKPVIIARTKPTAETGTVSRAIKNISEM
jgi:hypothetical protein